MVAGSGRGAKKSSVGFDNDRQLLLEIWEIPWYTKCLVSFFYGLCKKNVESPLLSSRKSADIRLPPYLVLVVLLNFQFLSQVFFASQEKTSSAFPSVFILPCRTHPSLSQKTTKKSPKFMRVLTHQQPTLCWNPQGYFPRRRPRFEESSHRLLFPQRKKEKKVWPFHSNPEEEERKGEFKGTQRWCWREAPAGPDAGKKEEKKSGERK